MPLFSSCSSRILFFCCRCWWRRKAITLPSKEILWAKIGGWGDITRISWRNISNSQFYFDFPTSTLHLILDTWYFYCHSTALKLKNFWPRESIENYQQTNKFWYSIERNNSIFHSHPDLSYSLLLAAHFLVHFLMATQSVLSLVDHFLAISSGGNVLMDVCQRHNLHAFFLFLFYCAERRRGDEKKVQLWNSDGQATRGQN